VCVFLTVKRYLPLLIQSASSMPAASNGTNQSAEALLSLKCPLAMRRMTLPARGHGCEHIQVNSTVLLHSAVVLFQPVVGGLSCPVKSA
jgi:hypothetical protein